VRLLKVLLFFFGVKDTILYSLDRFVVDLHFVGRLTVSHRVV
jgi:hypothetical protein